MAERSWAIAGVLIATVLAVLGALVAGFMVPYRIDGFRLPVSLLIVVVANVGAVRFAYLSSGWVAAAAGPALGWLIPTLLLGFSTKEGDIIITGDWVGFSLVMVGAAALAVAAVGVANSSSRAGVSSQPSE